MFDDIHPFRVLSILILGVILVAGLFLSSGLVVGQTTTDPATDTQTPTAFIRSRFMLWDSYEKSIDKNFNIALISWSNNSMNYTIHINVDFYNGTFIHYKLLNFTYVNISRLSIISVEINNQTILLAHDVRVVSGIMQSTIDNYIEPYKISFLPFELTRFEWNLILSGIVGVLIALPISYILVKYYRKHRGAQVV